MKLWNNYGSEHSANLVMIGRFKDENTAKLVAEQIDKLQKIIGDEVETGDILEHYPDKILSALFLEKIKFASDIHPKDLEDFLFDIRISQNGNKLKLTSDDTGFAGIIKMMVNAGAKVEIFSAHDFPKEDKDE